MGKKKKKKKAEKEARRVAREEAALAARERKLVREARAEARLRARRRAARASLEGQAVAAAPAPLAAPVPAAVPGAIEEAVVVKAAPRKRARAVKHPVGGSASPRPAAKRSRRTESAAPVRRAPGSSPDRPADRARARAPIPVRRRVETIAPPDPNAVVDDALEIEARLDRLLRLSVDPAAAERAPEVLGDEGERLAGRLGALGREPRAASMMDAARELLSSNTYLRVWGRLGMRDRSVEVDEYGLDPKYEQKWRPFFEFLYTTYWRVETRGVLNIPEAGRCLLVANHSGTIPYDGAMIKTAVEREHPARRKVRWLAEDFVFHFPFLGAFMNRIGAVRACQENADRMLRQDRLVAVFPEGIKGIGKLYRDRYQLQRFGRGGYIKLCLRTGAPIIPVAVVGAEEIHPLLFKSSYLAQAIGMPYIPVTPTFPALGPLGLVPAPTKWFIEFGEPIWFDEPDPDAAEDAILVNRLNDQVRSRIQQMVSRLLDQRKTVMQG